MIINLAEERRKRAFPLVDRLDRKTYHVLLQEAFDEQEQNGQDLSFESAKRRVNEWVEAIFK